MRAPFVKMMGAILEKGVSQGVFREGVDPVQMYITIAGMSYFYLSNQHTLSAIFGRSLLSPRAKKERLGHMIDVALSYLERR